MPLAPAFFPIAGFAPWIFTPVCQLIGILGKPLIATRKVLGHLFWSVCTVWSYISGNDLDRNCQYGRTLTSIVLAYSPREFPIHIEIFQILN